MTLLIIDMDFLYQIDCTTFHSFLSWNIWKESCFLKFSKVGRSVNVWLVGEVDNHVAIYGSRVAEGFSAFQRRSCSNLFSSIILIHIHYLYMCCLSKDSIDCPMGMLIALLYSRLYYSATVELGICPDICFMICRYYSWLRFISFFDFWFCFRSFQAAWIELFQDFVSSGQYLKCAIGLEIPAKKTTLLLCLSS